MIRIWLCDSCAFRRGARLISLGGLPNETCFDCRAKPAHYVEVRREENASERMR